MVNQLEGITIAGVTGISGPNASLPNTLWAVRLDNQLNLYVADSINHIEYKHFCVTKSTSLQTREQC